MSGVYTVGEPFEDRRIALRWYACLLTSATECDACLLLRVSFRVVGVFVVVTVLVCANKVNTTYSKSLSSICLGWYFTSKDYHCLQHFGT